MERHGDRLTSAERAQAHSPLAVEYAKRHGLTPEQYQSILDGHEKAWLKAKRTSSLPFPLPDKYKNDGDSLLPRDALAAVSEYRFVLQRFGPRRDEDEDQLKKATDVALGIRLAWSDEYDLELAEVPLAKDFKRPTDEDFARLEQWLLTAANAIKKEIAKDDAAAHTASDKKEQPWPGRKERWNMPKSEGRAAKARELIQEVNALEQLNAKYPLHSVQVAMGLPPEVQTHVTRIQVLAEALGIAHEQRVIRHVTRPKVEKVHVPGNPTVRKITWPEEKIEVVGPETSWYESRLALREKAEIILEDEAPEVEIKTPSGSPVVASPDAVAGRGDGPGADKMKDARKLRKIAEGFCWLETDAPEAGSPEVYEKVKGILEQAARHLHLINGADLAYACHPSAEMVLVLVRRYAAERYTFDERRYGSLRSACLQFRHRRQDDPHARSFSDQLEVWATELDRAASTRGLAPSEEKTRTARCRQRGRPPKTGDTDPKRDRPGDSPNGHPVLASPSGKVRLFGPGKPPVVNGKSKRALTEPEYATVEALLDAEGEKLTKDTLDKKAGRCDARKHLYGLCKDRDWAKAVPLPGRHGRGYCIP